MLFWILGLFCLARSCLTVFIDEMDCNLACVCCKGGADKCRNDTNKGINYCFDGCVDGIYGLKCRNPCNGNCSTCEQVHGSQCYSCKETFYSKNSNCTKSCSVGCDRGICDDDGTCTTCTANFEGTKCETCIQGQYGSNCLLFCTNPNCRCSTGTDCTSCKTRYFGKSTFCQTPCSQGCQDGICNDDGRCDCRGMFTGNTCSECQSGYYGAYCNVSCSVGCANGTCSTDGTCSCRPNFVTPNCDTCTDGKYSLSCDQVCSVGCTQSACNGTNGHCECLPNFDGDKCDKCKPGFYEQSCDLHCSEYCKGGTCSQFQGTCMNGCVDGYSGDNCTTLCDLTCATCRQYDKSYCMSCNNENSGPTCRCPPHCICDLVSDVCVTCTQGYVTPEKQCKCQQQYCIGTECGGCDNQTLYVDHNACCECPDNCKNGLCKNGPLCISGCIDGFYSPDCSQSCLSSSVHCIRCNQSDGNCLECSKGLYLHDNEGCITCNRNCTDLQCNSNNGYCIIGCTGKVWGDKCDNQCNSKCETCQQDSGMCDSCADSTVHGPHCNESCSSSCFESKCNQSSGQCLNGCHGDFYGNFCQTNCPFNCQKGETDTTCNADGSCKLSCVNGYEGDDCSNAVKSGPPVAAISGIVIGGVVVVIGVVFVLLLFQRRSTRLQAISKTNRSDNATFQANERTCNSEGEVEIESTNSNPTGTRPRSNKPSSITLQTTAHVVTASEDKIDSEIDDTQVDERTSNVHYTNFVTLQTPKVPVDALVQYVDSLTENNIRAMFGKFPQCLIKPYVHSQRSANIPRNRYRGIYPYDDCRVRIQNDGSDYINASFIDGYKKRREYIATLGPMSQQLGDEFEPFWQMVWQQKVEKIVMVTNLIENAAPKCEQYWPNFGTSKMYGEFQIKCHSEDMYAEFTRRAFKITRSSEERSLYQLHFTCWPDKGIPDDVTAIIEFRQRVLNTPTTYKGPTVVHCSAGVGRTGTYIALDILTKEGEAERAVDIPGCVVNLRQNRPSMIQTYEQYQYLHKAVVYSLTFNCKPIKAEHFQQYMKTTKRADLNRQFQQLQHTVEQRLNQEANAFKRNKQHLAKNRTNADIPGDNNRPRLYLGLTTGASDYINAVYIHSFKEKRRFLVAQTPLPETVTEFLTLVVQENCSCIVSFEPDMDKQRNVGIYYPAENMQALQKGSFEVSSSRETRKPNCAMKNLTIRHMRETGHPSEKTLTHMQFTEWDEMRNVPLSIANFLTFLNDVEEIGNKDGPILLHCFDGASRTGLFCVVSMLLRKMAVEHEVNVLNAVRKVKTMRRLAIPNLDQFIFCHESVQECLQAFDKDVYANFAGFDE